MHDMPSISQQNNTHPPKLLEQVRRQTQLRHYSIRTEKAYTHWIKRYIIFHDKRHPRDMGQAEIENFLSYLATDRHVAASTQNQALNALVFLYREVLDIELPWFNSMVRAKRPAQVPTVLTRQEVNQILAHLTEPHRLMASLLYGSGLRLMEAVRLRIKNVDFGYGQLPHVTTFICHTFTGTRQRYPHRAGLARA